MNLSDKVTKRFAELEQQATAMRLVRSDFNPIGVFDMSDWHQWGTSVLSLLLGVFGEGSPQYVNFKKVYNDCESGFPSEIARMKGVFQAAKADYDGGYLFQFTAAVSGEIYGDFVGLAKNGLNEGYKDVAAVLACAALEDSLKKLALLNGFNANDKTMQEVVNVLKAKGLVSGAQKSLLDTMPKLRNYAMHADWEKISSADVGSILGFVEQFLHMHFS